MSSVDQRLVTDAVPVRESSSFPACGITRDDRGVRHYDGLPSSLVAMLREQVRRNPYDEAVVELGGRRLTYGVLWNEAAEVAGGLRTLGFAPGERVAVGLPAGVGWVLAFWGTLMAGGVVVALNTRASEAETEFVVMDSGARIHFGPNAVLPRGAPYVVDDVRSDELAALFYTSGTTARPKGVPTTHEAFLTNAENMVRCNALPPAIRQDLRTLICVPLFHVTGCNSQLLVAAYVGGTAVIMPSLDVAGVLEALRTERISFLLAVPAVYSLLLRQPQFTRTDISGVRWIGYGGAPTSPSLIETLRTGFPRARLFNGYGLTETASLMTVLPDEEAGTHTDSVGRAVPVVDLMVAPLDDQCGKTGGTDPLTGELLARGPNVATGYWNRPEESAETFTCGWLRTGDVVRIDADGRVHLVDRLKDVINRGGEKVSSVEVEDVLSTAPGVVEAAVVGVPDNVMGEKVGAVLYTEDAPLEVEGVLAHCRTWLADFKVPQYVAVVDQPLPRNPSGKLLKQWLRQKTEWGSPVR